MVHSKTLIENSEFEKYLKSKLKKLRDLVTNEIEREITNRDLIQFKGFVDVKSIMSFSVNQFNRFLDNEKTEKQVDKFAKKYVFTGIEDLEKIIGLNLLGVKITTNFISKSKKYKILKESMMHNVKTIEERTLNKLKSEVFNGVINGESISKIKKRINETIKKEYFYSETMARTEANNLLSQGSMMAAKESGLNLKKYLSVHHDHRTSSICRELGQKYGTKDQAIDLNEPFTWSSLKGGSKQRSPFHCNCRSSILYHLIDE